MTELIAVAILVLIFVDLVLGVCVACWIERRITRAYWAGRRDGLRRAPFRRRVHRSIGAGPQDFSTGEHV